MKTRNPRGQLGRAFSIIAQHQMREWDMHADVRAWGAPSECHDLVNRGAARRERAAYAHASAVSGLKRQHLRKAFDAMPIRQYERLCAAVEEARTHRHA